MAISTSLRVRPARMILSGMPRIQNTMANWMSPDLGFIVMEHIDGVCSDPDGALVAAAVEFLITIKNPTTIPGPIGGGLIIHLFFLDWEVAIVYDGFGARGAYKRTKLYLVTVYLDLASMNLPQILAFVGSKQRVHLTPEVESHGLPFCPCDMNRNNFFKDREARIVAIDFCATCFLPSFDVALHKGRGDQFVKQVTQHLKRPVSAQCIAQGFLCPCSVWEGHYRKLKKVQFNYFTGIDYKVRRPTKNKAHNMLMERNVQRPVSTTIAISDLFSTVYAPPYPYANVARRALAS
ncbi:hypothetical protein BDN70DRAFT_925524 [Pholiota conissans]|uniref:Uncharacterized protein n=1 Tax=Pholiota conissans TaxID=109636 RepID=A0A9P6CT72_9AGAR|nr:hypothetical protein BDN70DRAFT_925524 [Pholiota conissans]